ncbi:hypothetical protein R3P38DRAFT_323319 [Favolaschia claudopus]|uniref:Cysteine-rich transmembrane CYSTM domain-containing protein n=1 Tax=Favolaschia claudopus TaxID=2862362 RepID=A0AAW0CUA7_9AGAR
MSPQPIQHISSTELSELPAFPPVAHTNTKSRIVSEQPAPAPMMSARERTVTEGNVERLRGGCIPCPDGGCCFIIPLPCCC